MADSRHANVDNSGLMMAAMAFRVKYRKVRKINVRIGSMGVHKKNRGGVYPAGIRVKSLCVEVLGAGFVKEEVSHVCIAVEEAPVQEVIRSGGDGTGSASTYNAENSCKDALLSTCFQAPYDDVRLTLLSHTHMMLVLRAFLTQAKWDIPPDTDRGLILCDSDGRLSVTAVAESINGKELAEVLAEGLQVELLSWQMDAEEPTAASIISQALNLPHQLAMRTTELTAVANLKGEIIVQMGKHLSQRVAFQTVRDKLRSQLQTAADDPDLLEVFDFLIAAGVGRNSYVDHLLEWISQCVNSKKRQLRFSAFAVINKMCPKAVWSRIALVKRAYRKNPMHGFCPSPESSWAEFSEAHLQKLEDVLRFFHVGCKDIVDQMEPPSERIWWKSSNTIGMEQWQSSNGRIKMSGMTQRGIMKTIGMITAGAGGNTE